MSNTYKIEVHSLGYEDYAITVEAKTLTEAKRHEREAKVLWCEHNAIDMDGNFELPFTRVVRVK